MSELEVDTARRGAKLAYKTRRFDQAAMMYAKVLETPPDSPAQEAEDRAFYGTTLAALGRLTEASAELARAVELAPDDLRNRAKLGEVLSRHNRPAEAVEQFRAILERQPNSATNHYRLAHELHRLGESAEAGEELQRCLDLEPDHSDALVLQLERSMLTSVERDGQGVEGQEGQAEDADALDAPIRPELEIDDWIPPPMKTPVRHRPWMVAVEAVGILIFALWLQSLFL